MNLKKVLHREVEDLEALYFSLPKTFHFEMREIAMAKKKKAAKKKPAAKKRPAAKKKTAKKRAPSGLTKMTCSLSEELQAVCGGSKTLTRPQIVKKLWAYIKAHKCQDAKNRRMIVPDKKLAAVIGNRPVDMLKLAGCLSKHIK